MLMLDAKKVMVPPDAKIDGSPYMPVAFESAFIGTKRGSFTDVPCRYNAFDDELEYQLKGVAYIAEPTPNILLIAFKDREMVVDKLPVRDYKYGFYFRLDSGKVTLLMRRPVQLLAPQAPKALESEGKPARYAERQDEFYIKVGEEIPRQFTSAKKLIGMLPDHQKEMEKFASENKISKNEEDLTKLIKYYNSL
jgi:hypothetical protein